MVFIGLFDSIDKNDNGCLLDIFCVQRCGEGEWRVCVYINYYKCVKREEGVGEAPILQ